MVYESALIHRNLSTILIGQMAAQNCILFDSSIKVFTTWLNRLIKLLLSLDSKTTIIKWHFLNGSSFDRVNWLTDSFKPSNRDGLSQAIYHIFFNLLRSKSRWKPIHWNFILKTINRVNRVKGLQEFVFI